MDTKTPSLKESDYYLIVSFLTIFTPLMLFAFRSLDDNRLTSWQWVFAHINFVTIVPLLIIGIPLAYVISRISFIDHKPTFLFFSSFVLAAMFWREPEVIVDATRYFTQAKHLQMYGIKFFFTEWGNNIPAWTDLPLVPFLYGIIFELFGESRIYIQVCTTLLFSLTVSTTYLIGKDLWDETTGYYAGLLLLGIPYLYTQIPLMLVDIPSMFFLTLAVFTLITALKRGGAIRIFASSIAFCLAFFSKYSIWLLLSVTVIAVTVFFVKNPVSTIRRGGSIALISGILIGIVVLFHYDVIAEQMKLLIHYQRPGIRRWGESFTSTFFFQTHPFLSLAALYSIIVAIRKKDMQYAIIGFLVLLFILLQIKRIRYTIPVFPMFALMASYGLRAIKMTGIRKFIVFCSVISSLVVGLFAYLPFMETQSAANLKNAGTFLHSLNVDTVEVVTLEQLESDINPAVSVPLLDLYTNKRITYTSNHNQPPLEENVSESPLRFSWHYKNPQYYRRDAGVFGKDSALAIIASATGQAIPNHITNMTQEYSTSREFHSSTGIFGYRTIVTIYY